MLDKKITCHIYFANPDVLFLQELNAVARDFVTLQHEAALGL